MLLSLQKNCSQLHVHVLCLDKETQNILSTINLSFVTLISLAEIEDEKLLEAKRSRGIAEYCWTLSPCLPWFVLQINSKIDFITYLDADLFFYSSVHPLFDEIGLASIAIIEHRFSPEFKEREINGRFCVEWVSFRRNEEGLRCLERWREQCIEWCYYRLEDGKMGDQKYLDEWPERYSSCHILQHLGAGVAPWNFSQYQFNTRNELITVDNQPLVFYHFHQFQILSEKKFDRLSSFYTKNAKEPERVYQKYEESIAEVFDLIRTIDSEFQNGIKNQYILRIRRLFQRFVPSKLKHFIRNFWRY